MRREVPSTRRASLVAALVIAGVLVGGIWFYRTEKQHLRDEVKGDLQAIAQLKTGQIVAWRTERLADAAVLARTPFFADGLVRWLADPTADGRDHILGLFRALCDHYRYGDVLLTDAEGRERLSLNDSHLDLATVGLLATAARERKPVFGSLHADETNQAIHLDLAVPLVTQDVEMPALIGVIILRIDPREYLYPLIRSWPVASRTSETLLVARDGDSVLFLNELRHQRDTALKLRIPLSCTDVPAVMAVLGREGFTPGKDYRGVNVLSFMQAIPDSPWFIVAKEDVTEARSIQRFMAALILLPVLALVLVAAVGVSVVWQRDQKAHYRSLFAVQERLANTAALLHNVINTSTDFIFLKDPQFRTILCNEAYARALGKHPEELYGKTDIENGWNPELVRGDPAQGIRGFEKDDRDALRGQEVHNPYDPANVAGEIRFFDTVKLPLRDAGDAIIGVLGMSRDVTEHKRAEEELRRSEERFRQVAESTGEFIWEVDVDGLYTYASPVVEDMLGYSPQEVIGKKHFYDFFLPEERESLKAMAFAGFGRRETFRGFLNSNVHKNGRVVILETNGAPIVDHRGQLVGYRGADTDITERTLSEKNQAQLVRQLRRHNQQLKEFAYIMSHDLKAPLRAIGVIADWLSMDYLDRFDAQGREYLLLLVNRVRRMSNFIDGVFQYSYIGRTERGMQPVDLAQLVPEIIENLSVPAHISIQIASSLPTIEADVTRITQVFQNLLSNAIRYLDKPQGHITVACTEDGGFWEFRVSDNGPGIEQKYSKRIFKLFQTLAPRDSSESTGAGLTITKKIVEMYGGRIWIKSEVGKGSTFFFTFPKLRESAAPTHATASTAGGHAPVSERAQGDTHEDTT